MTKEVKIGWDMNRKPPPKYDWKTKFEEAENKDIFKDKVAQINHIFNKEDKTNITKKGYMKVVINIPPSTLGYEADECIVSWKNRPMTQDELKRIAKKDNNKYKEGNIKAPSCTHIAVGYKLVKEEENNLKRKFKTYIMPTDV